MRACLFLILSLSSLSVLSCSRPAVIAATERDGRPSASLLDRAEAGDEEATAELRRRGYAGLDALLGRLDGVDPGQAGRVALLRAAADRVARQRGAHASRLFWHTDLDAAKAAAKAERKPILSLRLLGDLGDELSCANSRLFRAALYPDERVSAMLRRRFVLHWSSERPAPRLTIDYGDGRQITRTITGNSAHYVLDAEGSPIDVIPGLYGPGAFVEVGERILALVERLARLEGDARSEALRAYHKERREALGAAWLAGQIAAGVLAERAALRPLPTPASLAGPGAMDAWPRALVAASLAVGKGAMERPTVRALGPRPDEPAPGPDDGAILALIASRQPVRLGERSRAAVLESRMQDWSAATPAPVAGGHRLVALRRLEADLALDSVRNELVLHAAAHAWMAAVGGKMTFEQLNDEVYRALFLTPRGDPWLGLGTPGVYSGIEGDGVAQR